MSGYDTIQLVKFLEQELDKLGLMMTRGHDRHSVSLTPSRNGITVYSTTAVLFTGTLEELQMWVHGVKWAREYDQIIFGSKHNDRRERKEQDIRNRQLVAILKNEENKKETQ